MPKHTAIPYLISAVVPVDEGAISRAVKRQGELTKPPGSLGALEDTSARLAGVFRTERPEPGGKAVIVAAGDHGVTAQGVTSYPQEVTAQMVANFMAGGAAVSVMARRAGVHLTIVDAGVASHIPPSPGLVSLRAGDGTADITQGPAMTREQAERCVLGGGDLGAQAAARGAGLIGAGEMGIGNTTAASAIAACMTGRAPSETTGQGTGRAPDELRHKIAVVERALSVNRPDPYDPLAVLTKLGGFEIAVMAGVMLGAASEGRAVVLDGFISGAAALIATTMCPALSGYLFGSHRSAEAGHGLVLDSLGLLPLLDLGMRLGEGTGAVLAMGILESAAACLSEMATFAEAGVSGAPEGHGA